MAAFNRTFFNFTMSFLGILLVVFVATLVVNYLDNREQHAVPLEAESLDPELK